MRNAKAITMLLAMGLAFSGPLVAHAKKGGGGGGESQKGGLPALEDRVDAADLLITDLQGQNNWAVIDGTTVPATPTVVRSNPSGVTVTLVSTGVYEVTFTKDVSACAYTATIGSAAHAAPTQGQISVSGDEDTDNVDDVFVHTFDVGGTVPTDNSFHLYVSCP
jgi:hypothetical protein